MAKYSKDGEFTDPVVRCDSCQKILLVQALRERGGCVCGSRKVRNVGNFSEEEMQEMKNWGIDEDFLVLFEAVEALGVSNVR